MRRSVSTRSTGWTQAAICCANSGQFDQSELDARVEGRDETNANWIKEKVSFRSAVPGVRMTAYMLLPRNARPPYQALVYAPTGAAVAKGDSNTLRDPLAFTGVVPSGRAVIYPIYDGTRA